MENSAASTPSQGTQEHAPASKELAAAIGITEANLSQLKQGHVKGVRFETLSAICRELDCQPGDLLTHVPDDPSGHDRRTVQ